MSIPPWFSEDLPKENWHADVDFLEQAYDDIKDLAGILQPDPLWDAWDPVFEEKCDCGSVDGGDQSESEEVEDIYCPKRSSSQPDFNRTFLVLEQVLPRLRFAAQRLDTVIRKFAKRAQESRDRWQRRMQAEINQYYQLFRRARIAQTALRLERMPLEVLSSIIAMASQKDRHIPFTISRVNTTLRRLVLSMPLLWANLDAAEPLANSKIRIQRSRDVPLALHMSIPPNHTEDEAKSKLSKFIKLLEPERNRVQKIFIEHWYRQWISHSLPIFYDGGLNRLQTLHVGCTEEGPKYITGSQVPIQIRELRHRGILCRNPEGRIFSNIVRLNLAEITVRLLKLKDTLLGMPALEAVVLDDVRVRPHEGTPLDPIVLAHLRYLVVKKSKADLITPILDTPNLISLQLECPVGNSPSDPDTAEEGILPAIARRNTQLRRLHVVGCYMTAEAWAESFYSLPKLEYLRVKGCDIEGDHLAALSGSGSDAGDVRNEHRSQFPACQRLEELVFENEMSIDSGTVRDIVEVRSALPESEGIRRVQWITFRGCDADLIKDEDVQAMAQLTKGIACDLLDGKEAWAETLEESSAKSGDGWSSSDGESGSSTEEDSDE